MPDDFLFNEETGTITGYNASVVGEKKIVIPDQIAGKDVLYIGEKALSGQQIKKITFETTKLKAIGNYALSNNYIEEITIPSTVETIGEYAFKGCANLKEVHFENEENIKNLRKGAFSSCISLTTINLPKNITSIEDELFENCESLSKIDMPSHLLEIGKSAFRMCKGINIIALPNSLRSIGSRAFERTSIQSIDIPRDITKIELGTFDYCQKLEKVTLPEGIISIESNGFNGCAMLKSIELPNTLETLGGNSFTGTGLTSVSLPSSLKVIGSYSFTGTKISNIVIPGQVKSIETKAFYDCYNLISVTLDVEENSDIIIADDSFGNTEMTREGVQNIYISNKNIDSIPNAPWGALRATIHWKDGDTQPLLVYSGRYVFNVRKQSVQLFLGGHESQLTIPSSFTYGGKTYDVKEIGDKAFYGRSEITTVTIPDTVIKIGNQAFSNCNDLKEITFSKNLQSIGNYAFSNTSLSSIDLPESLNFMGIGAFGTATLDNIYLLDHLYGSIEDNESLKRSHWGAKYAKLHWKDRIEIPIIVRVRDYEYDIDENSIYKYTGSEKKIDIPRVINYIIDDKSPDNVTELIVEKLGSNAFKNATMTSVNIPNSVTEISSSVFANCSQLTDVVIPNSVETIGYNAFMGCSNLSKIDFPSNLKKLGNNVFYQCTLLKSVKIPKKVYSIGNNAFEESQLERIYIDQPRGYMDDHKNQPWGAPDNVQVFYQGESVEFQHSVEKNPDGGYDIQVKASILKNGIELPDGKIVRVGAQFWPSKNTYTYHVDSDGVYTFTGYDNRNLEYTYDVEVSTANIQYHSNVSSTNDNVVTKYIIENHDDLEMSRDDAVFMGWNTAADGTGSLYQPGDEIDINNDVTLYAQWKHYPEGTVIFKVRKGDETLGTVSKTEYAGIKGERLGNNAATATVTSIEGAKFIGWYKNNQKIETPSSEIIGDNAVYEARFILDRDNDGTDDRLNKYKVNFIIRESDKQKAIITSDSIEVKYNQKIGNQAPGYIIDTEVAPNVTFAGWYKNNTRITQLSEEVITDNVTYEARFNGDISRYRMNFIVDIEDGILNNTETYISQIIEMDGTVSIPTVTVNEGKKFMGWYKQDDDNQTIVNEADIIPETTTYVAKIEKLYQVTFKVAEGDNRKGELDKTAETVVSGTTLDSILPAVSTQKWSKFIGWYIDDKKIDDIENYAIAKDTIVEARFDVQDGVIIVPGTDGEIDTGDDMIVQPGTIDDKGNIIIPDGGTVIFPSGEKEEFPDGGIILPGEDGTLGTKDDVIVKPGTIDDKGNIIIPDGGTVIYPNGDREEFPDGGIIVPGEDGTLGTKDDVIVKPATIDDKGNIIIPDGGTVIYPNGDKEEFPNGAVITPGKDGKPGTKDDVIIKSGTVDDKGNIIISEGGEIIYPDGSREVFPNGGTLYAGIDGIFGTEDDLLIRNIKDNDQVAIDYHEDSKQSLINDVLTSDDTQVLLWSFMGVISMTMMIIAVKKKLQKVKSK